MAAAALNLALTLLRLDRGLGGIVLRGRAGPARDVALAACRTAFPDLRRLHPSMAIEDLDGGLDVQATLVSGAVSRTEGLLAAHDAFDLPMAERTPSLLASRLAERLDAGALLVACDEGIEDEAIPPALAARCAFALDAEDPGLRDVGPVGPMPERRRVSTPPEIAAELVALAARFGIADPRAPLLALRAARAHASLARRDTVGEDDLAAVLPLVYAHRTTLLPEEPEAPPRDAPDDPVPDPETQSATIPEDLLLDAVRAALPPDLLARLAANQSRLGKGAGSGAKRSGNRRGRPLPARQRSGARGRIDLIATLRAAAPWQTIRARASPDRQGPIVHPSDLRMRRYEETSDRLLIFTVDASGSAAFARLAEAKGAVELLLAQAYARRDQVALIAFRGKAAELLLPPTRSLIQTKRRLAALPGGGPTPLAHGLQAARHLANTARRRGLTPTLVLMTDGRANVALDGTPDRRGAAEDAARLARDLAAEGLDAIVIDTGMRPERALRDLATVLRAPYIPLPRADAAGLSQAVEAALRPA